MAARRREPRVRLLGQSATVGTCWVLGMCFAIIDALTTWYALEFAGLHEGNPVAKWAIGEFGLSQALALRILVGAVVLGIIAVGTWIQVPRHRELVNRSCRIVLIGALVLWGVVALSNTVQIALLRLA